MLELMSIRLASSPNDATVRLRSSQPQCLLRCSSAARETARTPTNALLGGVDVQLPLLLRHHITDTKLRCGSDEVTRCDDGYRTDDGEVWMDR
jgi:hypothetical protein